MAPFHHKFPLRKGGRGAVRSQAGDTMMRGAGWSARGVAAALAIGVALGGASAAAEDPAADAKDPHEQGLFEQEPLAAPTHQQPNAQEGAPSPRPSLGPSLIGRSVALAVQVYNDPAKPLFYGRLHLRAIGDGVEFDLDREGPQNGLDVIPVFIDVRARSIVIDYSPTPATELFPAKFNGYVIEFETECDLLRGARIDWEGTNLPVAADALTVEADMLHVNLEGLPVAPSSRVEIDLDLGDCPAANMI